MERTKSLFFLVHCSLFCLSLEAYAGCAKLQGACVHSGYALLTVASMYTDAELVDSRVLSALYL